MELVQRVSEAQALINNSKDFMLIPEKSLSSQLTSSKKFIAIIILITASIAAVVATLLISTNSIPANNIRDEASLNKFLHETTGPINVKLNDNHDEEFYKGNKHCRYVKEMQVSVSYDSPTELTFLVDDSNEARFRPPYHEPFPFTKGMKEKFEPQYSASVKQAKTKLQFKLNRVSTSETLFDTSDFNFIFSDKYIEVGTVLPTKFLYGLGERTHDLLYSPGTYTIWPFDQFGIIDKGGLGNQTYGHHPVYLMREKSGLYHVVYFRNFNAMSFEFKDNTILYKSTGGVIEFKFFLGDKFPETAIRQYHAYINKWTIQPFWSFGFHQCRWGYKSSSEILTVVQKYQENEIPMDVVWSDIDYMSKYQTFTVDSNNFQSQHFDEIFKRAVRWVPIFDFGIKVADNEPYKRGVELDIFIKSNVTNSDVINCVWPGTCVFPDFNHPHASQYWEENLKSLSSIHHFDGIWNDMNEIATFRTGEVSSQYDQCWENGPDWNMMGQSRSFLSYELPYLPFPPSRYMESRTLSMSSYRSPKGKFMNSTKDKIYEFDVHPLNGFLQSVTLWNAMKASMNIELPFILTRSSAPGSGGFAVHWTGDNLSTWDFLRYSIADILSFQIYGMPITGSDICGFMFHTEEELCARWFQLGAFYPFARNHNHNDARSQEAYAFGLESSVFHAAKASLKLRYSLLKYFYALHVAGNGVGTYIRPLFFEFPDEERFFALYSQFMIGRDLMVAPVLESRKSEVEAQIPNSQLFAEFSTGAIHKGPCVNVSAPLEGSAPLFIRQGAIIPFQETDGVRTTNDLSNSFHLKIFLEPVEVPQEENYKVFGSFKANGIMIGLTDFNSSFVVKECSNLQCILNIEAKGKTTPSDDKSSLKLTIAFLGNLKGEIKINKVSIYGLKSGDSFVAVEHDLGGKAIDVMNQFVIETKF